MRTRDTSIETYYRIRDEGLLSKRRWQVYDSLYRLELATGAMVAQRVKEQHGSWGHSETIRNRLTELRDQGVIAEVGKGPCPINGNSVIWWATNNNLPSKLPKKLQLTNKEKLNRFREALKLSLKQLRLHNDTESVENIMAILHGGKSESGKVSKGRGAN